MMDALHTSPAAEVKEEQFEELEKKSFYSRFIKAKIPYLGEFAITFALFFVRFLYYGWQYFYQLDDYIQYHNYTEYFALRMSTLWEYVADYLGLFAARPLAAFGDIYIISNFFSSMIVVVLALSLMYAATSVIFRHIFNKLFGTGYFFTLVFCLMPLAFEGLYWVSASSRIIPSLFFTALAALFMLKVVEEQKIRYAFLFAGAQILSFCYYEQITVISIVITALIAIIKRNKYSMTALLILANILLYGLYSQIATMLWDGGIYAARSEITLPFITKDYFTTVFPSATGQILQASGAFMPLACGKALWRGIKLIIADRAIVYLLAVALLSAACGFLLMRFGKCERAEKKKVIGALICGALLAIAPLAPFYILKSSWIGVRAIVPSLCGVALMLDALFTLILRGKRKIAFSIITGLVFICCIASVSEIHDYRQVTEFDTATANLVIEAVNDTFDEGETDETTEIAILNIGATSLPHQNYLHHEHVASATGAKWSMTGLLRCLSGNGNFPNVTAMPVDENGCFYYAAHGDSYRLENYDYVFVASGDEVIRVTPAKGYTEDDFVSENGERPSFNYDSFLLYTDDIIRLARVAEYSYYGTFELYQ